MIDLKFTGKPRRSGNSFMVTIPSALAKLLEKKEYTFVIKEGEKNGEHKTA